MNQEPRKSGKTRQDLLDSIDLKSVEAAVSAAFLFNHCRRHACRYNSSLVTRHFCESFHDSQIILIPRGWNFLPRRIWPRFIRARRDSLLAQLAHVPILFVRHVPELNRVLRFEVFSGECVRMKKPVAHNQGSFRRLRPELMHHHVFGVQREQHVRKDRIVKNNLVLMIRSATGRTRRGEFFIARSNWQSTSVPTHT